jgi:hypothetical protein
MLLHRVIWLRIRLRWVWFLVWLAERCAAPKLWAHDQRKPPDTA